MAHGDPEVRDSKDRERYLRRAAARAAAGLCSTCGRAPPASGRKSCEPCLVRRREADRLRHRRAAASGLRYGNAEKNVMPSGVREPADFQGFPASLLGINAGRHLPPAVSFSLSTRRRTTNVFDTQAPVAGDHGAGQLRPDHPCVHRRSSSSRGGVGGPASSLPEPRPSLSCMAREQCHFIGSGRHLGDRPLSAARLQLLCHRADICPTAPVAEAPYFTRDHALCPLSGADRENRHSRRS